MNKSKQKGTRAETNIVKALQAEGIAAERRALAGSNDKGDIKVELDGKLELIIEVKAGKQTVNPPRSELSKWLKQTFAETINSDANWGALVVCAYHRCIRDYPVYIYENGGVYLKFMFFNEFVEWLQVMAE